MTDDFFRARLEQMIDLKHPLAVLAGRMPWDQIEFALAPSFVRKDREGKAMVGDDLFGMTVDCRKRQECCRKAAPVHTPHGFVAVPQAHLQPQR